MMALLQDIRYDIRTLLGGREFAIAAVLCLALGIGINTVLFSTVNTVLLKPLPYRDPARLMKLYERHANGRVYAPSTGVFAACRRESTSIEGAAAYEVFGATLALPGSTEYVREIRATANLLDILGLEPVHGRSFLQDEDDPAKCHVAVLTEGAWKRYFGADPAAVGRTITLSGELFTVVGIVADSVRLLASPSDRADSGIDVVVPRTFEVEWEGHWIRTVLRLGEGVSVERAESDLDAIIKRIPSDRLPRGQTLAGARLTDLKYDQTIEIRSLLLLLQGAGILVLFIACLNALNLLLARNVAKQRSIVVRVAVGAGRPRIFRQALTETLFLSSVSGAAGLLLAAWGTDWFVRLSPIALPRLSEVAVDATVLAVVMLVCVLVGAAFGAIQAAHALKLGSAQTAFTGPRGKAPVWRLRWLLPISVMCEILLTFFVLSGAGLLANSAWRLSRTDPGFRVDNVLTATLIVPEERRSNREEAKAFVDALVQRLGSISRVQQAAASSVLPMAAKAVCGVSAKGNESARFSCRVQHISDNYFAAMDVAVASGGSFSERGSAGEIPEAVIGETLARKLFGSEDPVGKVLTLRGAGPGEAEIVGVVADVRASGLNLPTEPVIYVPYAAGPTMTLGAAVRTAAPVAGLADQIRREIWAIDPRATVTAVRPMEDIVSETVSKQRYALLLLSGFALTSLLLVIPGVYALSAYLTAQRTREVAIRMAVGARQREVLFLLTRRMLTVSSLGIVAGIAASAGLSAGYLADLVYGISPRDPVTLILAAVFMGIAVAIACYVPARRVTRVNPMHALKYY